MLPGYLLLLLQGAWLTLLLALAALPLGLALGLAGAGAKLSRSRALRVLAGLYTTVVRGVPEILIVFLLYYGPDLLVRAIADWLRLDHAPPQIPPFLAGVLALGLTFGGYATEAFRGAFLAIAKGQSESALALGMGPLLRFRRILLPQVWRLALPSLGNLWLNLLKETSILSVISLNELLRQADIAARGAHQPFLYFLLACALYLLLTALSLLLLRQLEKSAALPGAA